MSSKLRDLSAFIAARSRIVAALVAATLVFNGLVTVSRTLEPDADRTFASDAGQLPEGAVRFDDGSVRLPDGRIIRPDGTIVGGTSSRSPISGPTTSTPSRLPTLPNAGKVMGVTDKTIEVVYYWKGERTMSSPFLNNSAAEGANLDEALAFRTFVEFINRHDNDGTTLMGIPINLHGRKLVGTVVEAGNGDFSYAQTAEKIASELKPFAAISSHGGLSTYICPRLASARIFNLSSYDVGGSAGTLRSRTDGFCVASGLPWERQVDFTVEYLEKHKETKYGLRGEDRVYGVVYSQYPGLKDAAPKMIARLKAAGIPIAAVSYIPADLATSQSRMGTVIDQMRGAGVNTVIMPDANTPLNLTHAAQANGWDPDYYVWPCSGQDSTGMVRLFNAAQWEGASGLTCYDEHFEHDVTNDDIARRSEWYQQYREVRATGTPPAPSPLVYSGLAQLVAGISYAGRDLNTRTFAAAFDRVPSFRYDSVAGRTTDGRFMRIGVSSDDRAWIGDVAKLTWSGTAQNEGGATPGRYVYPEPFRYHLPSKL